jgi:hypothetical protein
MTRYLTSPQLPTPHRTPNREGQSAAMNWIRIHEIWYETLRLTFCILMGEELSLRNQTAIFL